MKKILGIALICLATSAWAQNSLLFEITSPKTTHTSYLFGTLHMADNRAFQWNDSVLWAIDQVGKTMFELDFDAKSMRRESDEMKALMNEWESFAKNEIAPEIEKLIDADTLATRAISVYAQVMDLAKKMQNTDRAQFVDQFLQDYARKQGKTIVGIETAMEQLEAITAVDKKQLKKAIIKFVKKDDWDIDLKTALGDQEVLIDAYSKLSMDEVCPMMNDVINASSNDMVNALYDRIFTMRNELMFNRLKDVIANESVFIGVGAGHLCSKTGLIEQFSKAGYTIRPVNVHADISPIQEWKTFSNDQFSVKVPEQVSNFYETNTLSSEYGSLWNRSSGRKNDWYTHKGKISFTIERTDFEEIEAEQELMEIPDVLGYESFEEVDEAYEIPNSEYVVDDVEVIDEPIEDVYMIPDDGITYDEPPAPEPMEDAAEPKAAYEYREEVIEEAVVEEEEIAVEEIDSPPVEYNSSSDKHIDEETDPRIDGVPYDEEYWDRFGKRIKKEMMAVMFSGFAGYGQAKEELPEPEPIYVEVMGEKHKVSVNNSSAHAVTYRLKLVHEGKQYTLKLKGDRAAFEDGKVLEFFTSFTVN